MKAYKNTISENIKQALLLKPRTRKEIIRLVVTNFKPDMLTDKEYNEAYKTNLRGYYSAFFTDCKRKGNIEKIDGKYHVTKSCRLEGNGLWSMNKDEQIKRATRSAKRIARSMSWQEIRHVNKENNSLRSEIRSLLHAINELKSENQYLKESSQASKNQATSYRIKLDDDNNKEINININLDITK